MGVRQIDRFLEQWQIGIRDLHRRTILALTPGSESTGRLPTCWPRKDTTQPAAAANHAWLSARFGKRRSPPFCRGTLHLQARKTLVTPTWAGHLCLSGISSTEPPLICNPRLFPTQGLQDHACPRDVRPPALLLRRTINTLMGRV